MRWTQYVLLLAMGICPGEGALAQQGFAISGTVMEHGSGHPLKNAAVTIAAVGQEQDDSASYRTGGDGRFAFTQLRAGKYNLRAVMRGFPPQMFAQHENYSTAITVGPGLDTGNVIFPLSAGGSISGTVLDEEGDPVRQARVWLFRKGVSNGRSRVLLQGRKGTESSGQFRFPYLQAGTYFVAVQADPWYAQGGPMMPLVAAGGSRDLNRELDVSYPLTYYGGADPGSASALAVTEGSSSNLEITLRPVPSVHLQVSGLDTHNGVNVSLSQETPGGFQPVAASSSCNENVCEASGVAPGRYLLSVNKFEQDGPPGVISHIIDLMANTTIDVGSFGSNSLSGRIAFDGMAGAPSQAAVVLQSSDGGGGIMIHAAADGTLKADSGSTFLPGHYQLQLVNAPDFYLKSIAAKGATVSAGELEVPEGASLQLSLVAAKGLSSINGTAVREDKPFAGAMVLLIPKDFSRTDFVRRDQSDSDGTFTLPEVAPGEYMLLAIEDGSDLAYREPAAMKAYLSGASVITAPLRKGTAVTVNVLPRQPQAGT